MTDNKEKYNKIGNFFSFIVLIVAIIIAVGFAKGAAATIWILAIANLICGPLCLILYLIEVKKGVFSSEDE